jgi:maltooligosyltrehalose trehalohydrolase
VVPSGGTHFRVWAPTAEFVAVQLGTGAGWPPATDEEVRLAREQDGYFSGYFGAARPGMLYRYKLTHGCFPDPASRYQPEGPHGPSQIVDPACYQWHDPEWTGLPPRGQVIYEMHIGTFTQEGT